MAKNKVVFKDMGLKAIEKALKAAAKIEAKVGIVDDPELALIGTIQEYGSPANNIQPRSFIKSTVDHNKSKIAKDLAKGASKLFKTKGKFGPDEILEETGENLAGEIKKRIESGRIPPALDDKTIKAKGSKKTLVDTGALANAIKVKIEK